MAVSAPALSFPCLQIRDIHLNNTSSVNIKHQQAWHYCPGIIEKTKTNTFEQEIRPRVRKRSIAFSDLHDCLLPVLHNGCIARELLPVTGTKVTFKVAH